MQWSELLCEERIRSFQKGVTSSDLRTEFEKDYHRIIGSASFRRLQDKTQVFPLDKSDFIRTRLTHSLEVSSFGKSLGQNISERIMSEGKDPSFDMRSKAAVCDLLQCAGLLHDIGNPPFGHFGETVIRDFFIENMPLLTYKGKKLTEVLTKQMREDFYHFEGNTQALRVVTKLHFLVDEHGMNLTKALLATIIKYPVSSLQINKKSGNIKDKKLGYYYADREIFAEIQDSCGTQGARHPLAYVLEAADDIAYKTADIEDACKKGLLSYKQLLEELKKDAPSDNNTYKDCIQILEHKYDKAVKNKYENPGQYAVSNWIVNVQGKMIACATQSFMEHYDAIMSGSYDRELLCGTKMEELADRLSDIAFRYAFQSMPILKLEVAAQTMLTFLLEKFVDAAIHFDTQEKQTAIQKKMMQLISENYKRIYEIYARDKSEEERLYLRLLLVTDYVCGMTDSYAKSLYQELNGIV
ncbi:MAG: deoxyguanosinetriphosphate triphosphohydrolase [Lachnospiraceae bacterium]|nr:deoxyguanosinetriphosphate triphosphohydrolase [Lachnospiraceae bacterium]